MSFTMPVFFIFLPTVLLLSYYLPDKFRWMILLAASYLFYGWQDPWLLTLIFATTLTSYVSARVIEQADTRRQKRQALFSCLLVCLGILFVFKYLDFTLQSVFALSRLFGARISFDGFSLLLPVGISFYVFQTLSYTLDVYRGDVKAERHFGYYALFVSFFPQLVAGPIERPGSLLPQLRKSGRPSTDDISQGFSLFLKGYAKKLLVADYLAGFVNFAYENIASSGGAAMAAATVLFAIQIYCDFSGYSDIAQGCARFLGIRLSDNFRLPYRASSIRDFWHRWHISLTRWFTDYLYIPLGGSKKGPFCHYRNILITFLVSGLWHGADWSFVIWGGLHGVYLTAEAMWQKRRRNRRSVPKDIPAREVLTITGKRLATFLLVCFAWIFFRSATVSDAFLTIKLIFTDWAAQNWLAGLGMSQMELAVTGMLLLLLPLLERLPAAGQHRTALLYFLLSIAVLICRCLVLSGHGETAFIYFQF